jgi:hypothetical protein
LKAYAKRDKKAGSASGRAQNGRLLKPLLITVTVVLTLLTAVFSVLYAVTGADGTETCAISFGTTAYHFCMRFAVAGIVSAAMQNRADYRAERYRLRAWEKKLYNRLRVKRWKNLLPTYRPEFFDPRLHSWEEIARATCQAETVHAIIVALSFLPIVCIVWFGEPVVFIVTSVLSAALDLLFVIAQRYNRARIVKLIRRT